MHRRRPSPTTIIAIAALVIALGGTAIAASRYIITSTSQIKPSVVGELRGASIVAHLRSARPVTAPASELASGAAADPLAVASWIQRPGEVQELVGRAVVTAPSNSAATPTCTRAATGSTPGRLIITVLVDGKVLAQPAVPAGFVGPGEPATAPRPETDNLFTINPYVARPKPPETWLFEPTRPERHVASVTTRDTCGLEGGVATERFTIDSVSIDVVGLK
jgi:hypothetical protein